ncbi:MAG: hypothetical protein AAF869_06515 [Pseudomonadota bacterium]
MSAVSGAPTPWVDAGAGALIFLLAMAMAAAGTRLIAMRLRIFDEPNARSSHSQPTPRAGGLAVIGAFLFMTFLVYASSGAAIYQVSSAAVWSFLALVAFCCMAALADDLQGMRPTVKFAFQSLAAVCFAFGVARFEMFPVPFIGGDGLMALGGFSYVLTVIWIVGFMNVFNFMDGVNGLAAGVAAIACVALAVFAHFAGAAFIFTAALALAGALCGFLIFNLPSGRVFLGDNGSQPIGFAIAGLAVLGAAPSSAATTQAAIPALAAPLIFLPFLVDVAATLVHRAARGQNVLAAHNEHFYQILFRSGYAHPTVSSIYYAAATACAVAAGVMMAAHPSSHWLLVAACLPIPAAIGVFAIVQGKRCGVLDEIFRPAPTVAEVWDAALADDAGDAESAQLGAAAKDAEASPKPEIGDAAEAAAR